MSDHLYDHNLLRKVSTAELEEDHCILCVDINLSGDHFDLDDEVALQKAKKQLVQQLFKPTDGPISRNFNRRFLTKISTFLAGFNVSPNSLILVSFFLSIVAAILFYTGGYAQILAGGIVAQPSSIIDGCDGEVARLKFKFSASLRIGRDVRLFIIFLGALANQLLLTLILLAIISNFEAIRRLFILKNAYKVETANL